MITLLLMFMVVLLLLLFVPLIFTSIAVVSKRLALAVLVLFLFWISPVFAKQTMDGIRGPEEGRAVVNNTFNYATSYWLTDCTVKVFTYTDTKETVIAYNNCMERSWGTVTDYDTIEIIQEQTKLQQQIVLDVKRIGEKL